MRFLLSFILCFITFYSLAQKIVFEVGANSTNYQYQNLQGVPVDYLKPASGLHAQIKRENILWGPKNNTEKTRLFIPSITYALGFTYDQYNSVGNTQGMALSYQTDHIGLLTELGTAIPILQSISLDLKGIISTAKMWNGNQSVGNQFMQLNEQDQFTKFRFYSGYSFSVEHHLSKFISGFIKYQKLYSVKEPDFPINHLRFVPTSLSLGVKINP